MKSKPFLYYVNKTDTCWLWTGYRCEKGYGKTNHNGKKILAHRKSFILFKGPIPKDMCVCHSCDISSCVNPDHLWLGTQAENIADMFLKGRQKKTNHHRSKNPNVKLSEAQVKDIRKRYCPAKSRFTNTKNSQSALAIEFNVSRTCIKRVADGFSWK